jgi:hypothetical protein
MYQMNVNRWIDGHWVNKESFTDGSILSVVCMIDSTCR